MDFIGLDNVTSEPARQENGFFEPGSLIRRINQEAVVMLGGGYAILLQLAHPFVAAGVDDHSNFQSEILSRLYRTVLFMHNLVFEDRQRARKALQQFHVMHERIRGRLGHPAGRFPADTPYSGTDPQTKLWVHATFVDTGLKVYEQFVRPLTPEERHQYYADSLILARLLEVPEEILPKTMEEFQLYINRMLSGDTLAVTDTTRRLAHAVLYPDVGFLPGLSAGMLRFVTPALLPERFRREYRLKWGRRQQWLFNCFRRSIRFLRPAAPSWVWQNPLQNGKLTKSLLWGNTISGR